MTLWLLDDDGHAHRLSDSFTASFYAHGSLSDLHVLCQRICAARLPVQLHRAKRNDLFERRELEVLEITMSDPARFPLMVQTVRRLGPTVTLYNCTVPLAQFYFYARGLFPFARVEVDVADDNSIRGIQLCDSPWDIDYDLPPFKVMTLQLDGDGGNPNYGARPRPIELRCDGNTHVLQDDDPREFLGRLQELLRRYDPDLILSAYCDSFILPRVLEMSRRLKMPLAFNRDTTQPIQCKPPRSYYSYGRVIYRSASHTLFGRLHLDLLDAFLFGDYGLDGLFEMARLAQMPLQRVARTSTGTCLTSMEMSTAYREQILIPSVKREAEMFQSLDQLPLGDKGGLVYQPVLGLHEQVAELDFSSMFPSIMDKFNISAETLACNCCSDAHVPELGLTICQKRRGLVPTTLAPIIAKRVKLKAKIRALPDGPERDRYKRLASCGKWIGVVSFGYMGHHNAIFGNITAHQAICAFARDRLLMAKEVAEARGFRLFHAIIDAIFVQKRNARAEEYTDLTEAIGTATGLKIDIEGIYNWVAFLPSRQDPQLPVANRYFGVFQNGEVKLRGIEARREDTCAFIRTAQTEMIQLLAGATNRKEFQARVPQVIDLACSYLDRLRSGQVPLEELAITQTLSRDPRAYIQHTLNAIVAQQLLASGVELSAGHRIHYVIVEHQAKAHADRARALEHLDGSLGYDAERYGELLLRAVEAVLAPAGIRADTLQQLIAKELPAPEKRARLVAPTTRPYWGPLFAWVEREELKRNAGMISLTPNLGICESMTGSR
jgi:DNA polymerase elongation subunit (family B)